VVPLEEHTIFPRKPPAGFKGNHHGEGRKRKRKRKKGIVGMGRKEKRLVTASPGAIRIKD